MKYLPIFDRDEWGEILDSLTRNKLRSFLTAFGIFWGVFMLVLLMGGGRGLQTIISQNMSGFATNSGFMFASTTSMPYNGLREGRYWEMQLADLNRIRAAVPEVDIVSGYSTHWGSSAMYKQRKADATVQGIFPNYQNINDPRLLYGRRINDLDMAMRRKVCVVGRRVVEQLFPGEDNVCGRTILVDGIAFRIVGQSGRSGNGIQINGNSLQVVEIPFTTMQQAYGQGDKIQILCFTTRPGYKVSDVQNSVERVLKHAHRIHPDDTQAVIKINTEALFTVVDDLFNGISILVWMIGLGTLLSGAIGVSNIMMVTVRERTTEIGIRRAIGATPRDIMRQIMSESMVLTLLAGLSGITAAVWALNLVGNIVRNASTSTSEAEFLVSFWLALGATIFIALLGLLAGLTPALRAMRIKPVEAMRDDE